MGREFCTVETYRLKTGSAALGRRAHLHRQIWKQSQPRNRVADSLLSGSGNLDVQLGRQRLQFDDPGDPVGIKGDAHVREWIVPQVGVQDSGSEFVANLATRETKHSSREFSVKLSVATWRPRSPGYC